jgi:hypothetical protein
MTPEEKTQFIHAITEAVKSNVPVLSDDEIRWVRLAIEKDAQTIKFRQAVIDKTLGALIKSAVTAAFVAAAGWFFTHIYKP